MKTLIGIILTFMVVLGIVSAGCIDQNASVPAPVGGNTPQEGVMIMNVGDVTGQGEILPGVPRGTIDTITFTIGLVPGAKPVNIENLTIVYSDAVRTETFLPVYGFEGNPPPGYWGIIGVLNALGSTNHRLEYEKQFIIRIHPRAPIVPNELITL